MIIGDPGQLDNWFLGALHLNTFLRHGWLWQALQWALDVCGDLRSLTEYRNSLRTLKENLSDVLSTAALGRMEVRPVSFGIETWRM
ncbi:MAG TPA: hypothetical protein DIU35_18955 [Candidatus Latescibacteria bacterium]|nr:hypothetical protein [Gemmatimonadota bacterium]HCR19563.1 hypothetical protein [Candidatus Latescibacterota bacterium]